MLPFHKTKKSSGKNKHSKSVDDNAKHRIERPAKLEYFADHRHRKKRRGKVSPHHDTTMHMRKITEFHKTRDHDKQYHHSSRDNIKLIEELTEGRGDKRGSKMYRYVKAGEVNKIHLNEEDKSTIQIIKNIVDFDDQNSFRNYRNLLYNRVSPASSVPLSSVPASSWIRDRAAFTAIRQLPFLNRQTQVARVKLPQSYANPVKWRKYCCKDGEENSFDRSPEQHHVESATTKSNINKVVLSTSRKRMNNATRFMNASEKARFMRDMHRQRIKKVLLKHACVHGKSLHFQNVLCMKNKLKLYHYDLRHHRNRINVEKWGQEDRDVRGVVPANSSTSTYPVAFVTGINTKGNTDELTQNINADAIRKDQVSLSPPIAYATSLGKESNADLPIENTESQEDDERLASSRSVVYQYHYNRESLKKRGHFHPHKLYRAEAPRAFSGETMKIVQAGPHKHLIESVGPKRHMVTTVDSLNNGIFKNSSYHSYTDFAFDNEGYVTLEDTPRKQTRKIYTNVTYTDAEVKQSSDPHLKLDSMLMHTDDLDQSETPENLNTKEPFIEATEGEWFSGDNKILVDGRIGKRKGDKKTRVKNNKDYSSDVITKAIGIGRNMNGNNMDKMINRVYGADVIAKGVSLHNKMSRNKTQNVLVLEDSDGFVPIVKNGYRNINAEKAMLKQRDYDKKLRILQKMNEEEATPLPFLKEKTDIIRKKARGYASEEGDVLVGRDKTVKHHRRNKNITQDNHVKITKNESSTGNNTHNATETSMEQTNSTTNLNGSTNHSSSNENKTLTNSTQVDLDPTGKTMNTSRNETSITSIGNKNSTDNSTGLSVNKTSNLNVTMNTANNTSSKHENITIESYKVNKGPSDSNFIKRYPTTGFLELLGSPESMTVTKVQKAHYLAPTNTLTDSRYYYQAFPEYNIKETPIFTNKPKPKAASKFVKSQTTKLPKHAPKEIREKKESDEQETIGNVTFISSKILGKIPNKIYMKAIATPGDNNTSSINAIIYSSKTHGDLNIKPDNKSTSSELFGRLGVGAKAQNETAKNSSDDRLEEVNDMIESLLMPKWYNLGGEKTEKAKSISAATETEKENATVPNSGIDPILDEAFQKLNGPEIADIILSAVNNTTTQNDTSEILEMHGRRENITTPAKNNSSHLDPFATYSTNMSASSSSGLLSQNKTVSDIKNATQLTPSSNSKANHPTKKINETSPFADLISKYLNGDSIENVSTFDNAFVTAFRGCKRNVTLIDPDNKSPNALSLLDCLAQSDDIFTNSKSYQKENGESDEKRLHRTEILNSDEPRNITTAILGLNIRKSPKVSESTNTTPTQLKFRITYMRNHNNSNNNSSQNLLSSNHSNDTLTLNFADLKNHDIIKGGSVAGNIVSANRAYSVDVDDNDEDTPDISIDVPLHDLNGKSINAVVSHNTNASLRDTGDANSSALNENEEFLKSLYANLTRLANAYENLSTEDEVKNATSLYNELKQRIDGVGKKYGIGKSVKRGLPPSSEDATRYSWLIDVTEKRTPVHVHRHTRSPMTNYNREPKSKSRHNRAQ